MVFCIGHSIISPLGEGSKANFAAVQAGRSGLKRYDHRFADVEPICASLFDQPQAFVPMCIRSVELATAGGACPLDSHDTIFILSTTKGDNLDLWTPAVGVASYFANPNPPIVVSNACTSGVCAQITAQRLLESGMYKHAVVVGCDLQSRFIVSGFQAFKALSPEPCLPFSEERQGLNLGEAAATVVYSIEQPTTNDQQGQDWTWSLESGAIHNDATHISAPSRTGDGAFLCLRDVMQGVQHDAIRLIGVHGTATLYNDDMERAAIHRAGLDSVPMCVLKPFFGHTMGAAGILETILCVMQAQQDKTENEQQVHVIKMLSGFGGVNAAIRLRV